MKLQEGSLFNRLRVVVRRYTVRNERLRICERLQLGGKGALVLVECDGLRFLAGLSSTGVQTLLPLHDPSDGARL